MTIIRTSALALALTFGITSVALAGTPSNQWYKDQNAGPYVPHTSKLQVVDNVLYGEVLSATGQQISARRLRATMSIH